MNNAQAIAHFAEIKRLGFEPESFQIEGDALVVIWPCWGDAYEFVECMGKSTTNWAVAGNLPATRTEF